MRRDVHRARLLWALPAVLCSACVRAPVPPALVGDASLPASAGSCFAVERLPEATRTLAQRALLELADGEALYTLLGGVKPVSSGVSRTVRVAPTIDSAALDSLTALRAAAEALQCGPVVTFVQVYAQAFPAGGDTVTRAATLVVVDRAALAGAIGARAPFFGRLAVTPATDARDVLFAVETAPRAERWRGYGHLFGYPDEAVDFFVRAGVRGDSSGRVEPRDFRRIETWRKYPATRGGPPILPAFVYAVDKGAPESADDRDLRTRAVQVYARYAAERATVGGDSLSAIAPLLRRLRTSTR